MESFHRFLDETFSIWLSIFLTYFIPITFIFVLILWGIQYGLKELKTVDTVDE